MSAARRRTDACLSIDRRRQSKVRDSSAEAQGNLSRNWRGQRQIYDASRLNLLRAYNRTSEIETADTIWIFLHEKGDNVTEHAREPGCGDGGTKKTECGRRS